jgi:hypothetical protein
MTREWKPGDVAWFKGRSFNGIVFRYQPFDTDDAEWVSAVEGGAYPLDDELRPLLVLDPEDREQVLRLADYLDAAFAAIDPAGFAEAPEVDDKVSVNIVRTALRSLLDPKPEEPKGLGAVVRDHGGRHWIRAGRIKHSWYRPHGVWAKYVNIDVVEVLSHGVPEDGAR